MNLQEEKLEDFNTRMNEWISTQGLFFQLTHNGTGLGERPSFLAQLFRLLLSLILLIVAGGLVYGGFLFWKVHSSDFEESLGDGLASALGLEEVTARGFKRESGSGNFYQILAEGNDETFFDNLEARGTQFKMSPFDGVFGTWNAGTIQIPHLLANIKAGAIDDEHASKAWASLFPASGTVDFTKIESPSTDLSWGYSSPQTWGSIRDSQLTISKKGEGWQLVFRGGTFSQGIFQNFEIQRMEVFLEKDKLLTVKSASMTKGDGKFVWKGGFVEGSASPRFEGTGELTEMPVESFFTPAVSNQLAGTISGTVKIAGSPNTSEGVGFEIAAVPGEAGLSLTQEIPLLRLLGAIDNQNGYRKLTFTEGGLNIVASGNTVEFNNISLRNLDARKEYVSVRMTGSFATRPANPEEINLGKANLSSANRVGLTVGSDQSAAAGIDNENLANLFAKHQPQVPPVQVVRVDEVWTPEETGEGGKMKAVEFPFLEQKARDYVRAPLFVTGQVFLEIRSIDLREHEEMAALTKIEEGEDLYNLEIDLNDLDIQITTRLCDQWDRFLNLSGE